MAKTHLDSNECEGSNLFETAAICDLELVRLKAHQF